MNTSQVQPSHDEIAILAYELSTSPGANGRSAEDNWLEAERILKTKRLEAASKDTKQLKSKKTPKRTTTNDA